MAELDGSFYGSNAAYLGAGMGGSAGGATTCTNLTVGGAMSTGNSTSHGLGGGAGGARASSGAAGGGGSTARGNTSAGAFHTTELSITPTMAADEQFIDLGSLRRFSIDRQSFLGKVQFVWVCIRRCVCMCACVLSPLALSPLIWTCVAYFCGQQEVQGGS